MKRIWRSVGNGGVNDPVDVRTVQELIRERGVRVPPTRSFPPMASPPFPPADGFCDRNTVDHIVAFQIEATREEPTGLVLPESSLLYALNGMSGGNPPSHVRRVVFKHFTWHRVTSAPRVDDPDDSGIDELVQGLPDLIARARGHGPLFAGNEQVSRRRSALLPFRLSEVNGVEIVITAAITNSFGDTIVTVGTDVSYDWGEPGQEVVVRRRRTVRLTGRRVGAPENRTFRFSRAEAQRVPNLLP